MHGNREACALVVRWTHLVNGF